MKLRSSETSGWLGCLPRGKGGPTCLSGTCPHYPDVLEKLSHTRAPAPHWSCFPSLQLFHGICFSSPVIQKPFPWLALLTKICFYLIPPCPCVTSLFQFKGCLTSLCVTPSCPHPSKDQYQEGRTCCPQHSHSHSSRTP